MKEVMISILRVTFHFILVCVVHTSLQSQEPVSPNGKFVTVKGLKLYYEETGKGTPLVLLHGFTGTGSMWNPFIPALSKSYRIINIDLPGHGRSDYMDTTEVYSHKKAAQYILAMLHQMQIDSVYVIGGSSGGMITLYMATLEPRFTRKIIVMAGQTYFSQTTRNLITSMGPPSDGEAKRTEHLTNSHGKVKADLLLRQFWNFRKLYGDPSFTPDVLSTITARTLIVHGDNDPIAPVSNAFEMYKYIPDAHLWIIPNGKHEFIFIPSNHADLETRLLEFLNGKW